MHYYLIQPPRNRLRLLSHRLKLDLTPKDAQCRSEAAIYYVDLQPHLKQIGNVLDAEIALPDVPQVVEEIRQSSKEIRALSIPSCALPARDIFLEGLERYANAALKLATSQDISAFDEEQAASFI